jgi:hypothetical protein
MSPIPMTIWHDPPKHAVVGRELPRALAQETLDNLCHTAGILCRVSGGTQDEKRIVICDGNICLRVANEPWSISYVSMPDWQATRVQALRVLETLAYAFHDYEARECVSFRGLFIARRPIGRPPVLGRPRTAAERMRDMRMRKTKALVVTSPKP